MNLDRFERLEIYRDSGFLAAGAARARFEAELLERRVLSLRAFCWVCESEQSLELQPTRDSEGQLAWRESLRCPRCKLVARKRFGLHTLAVSMQAGAPPPYLTEQVSPAFIAAKRHWPGIIGSEFMRSRAQKVVQALRLIYLARSLTQQVRHEDLTALTLPDASIGGMLSMDVLEHIADTKAVLREARRVLVPGAPLVVTAPFLNGSQATCVRAVQEADGSIRHLLEPEYHGDPLDPAGVLCFYHFGWDLLNDMREAGFARAEVVFSWDPDFGYLSEQMAFVAFA